MTLRPLHRIKSRVQTRHGFGRDEHFVAERFRKEHMHQKNRQARQDLIAMRQKLALGQIQADIANELHRVDGYLQTQTRVVRNDPPHGEAVRPQEAAYSSRSGKT